MFLARKLHTQNTFSAPKLASHTHNALFRRRRRYVAVAAAWLCYLLFSA